MTTDRPRCTAKNRRGEPCRRAPIKGGSVCPTHGGSAPQVKAAAAERQADAAAAAAIAALWPGLADADPVKDPVDLLARAASVLEAMTDRVGARVNNLNGKVGAGEHLTQLRAEVVLLDRLLDKLIKASDALARLGIAERQVELAAGQAEILEAAFRAGLAALGSQLLPDQRDVMIRAVLDALPGGQVVAGEVVRGE